MRSLAFIFAILILSAAPLSVRAAGEPAPLSFADAITIALQQNPAYLASASDVAGAQARLRAAHAPLGPSFTIQDTYQLQSPVAQLQTPFGALPFAPNSTNVPLATIGYTLSDGGLTAARIAQADAQLAGARALQREAATATVGRVATAYYDLVAAIGSADVAERSVAVSTNHATLVQQRLEAGTVPRADLLQAQTQLADTQVRLIDARNAVDRASEALDAALGVSLDTRYKPTDALDESAQMPALTAMLSAAHESRGELAASRDAIVAARAALSAAKAGGAPRVGISASEGNVQPPIEPGFHSQFSFGLSAVWTVFDNGVTAANVSAAEASIRHATLRERELETSVDLEVRQAYDDVQAAVQRLAAAHALFNLAAENQRLAEVRYRGGVGTLLELRDAQLQNTSAQQTMIAARAGLRRSVAALRIAAGLL